MRFRHTSQPTEQAVSFSNSLNYTNLPLKKAKRAKQIQKEIKALKKQLGELTNNSETP